MKVSVLVVDDDTDIREIVSEILTGAGYSVAAAGNGADALTALETVVPELILLDLNMPVMDGVEFRAQQQKKPEIAEVPTIVMSAMDRLRTRIESMNLAGSLEKPIELGRLLEVVAQFCGPPARA